MLPLLLFTHPITFNPALVHPIGSPSKTETEWDGLPPSPLPPSCFETLLPFTYFQSQLSVSLPPLLAPTIHSPQSRVTFEKYESCPIHPSTLNAARAATRIHAEILHLGLRDLAPAPHADLGSFDPFSFPPHQPTAGAALPSTVTRHFTHI